MTLTVTVTDDSSGGGGDGGNEVTISEGAVALIPDSVTWDESGEIARGAAASDEF